MPYDLGEEFYLTSLGNGWNVGKFRVFDGHDSLVHMVTTREALDTELTRESPKTAAKQANEALDLEGIAYCQQVHGKHIITVNNPGVAEKADGMVTNSVALGLMCFSADCPLILAYEPISGAVGMAHASWRATIGQISRELVVTMASRFSAQPSDIVACICPSVGPCCYEVGDDVFNALTGSVGRYAERFFTKKDDKMYLDLWVANADELERAGLKPANIHVAKVCTVCHNYLFPSHRKEGEAAGRFAAIIANR